VNIDLLKAKILTIFDMFLVSMSSPVNSYELLTYLLINAFILYIITIEDIEQISIDTSRIILSSYLIDNNVGSLYDNKSIIFSSGGDEMLSFNMLIEWLITRIKESINEWN
jgi:hypothetical protein